MISFILLAADCTMASRPLVEASAQKLLSQAESVTESQSPGAADGVKTVYVGQSVTGGVQAAELE